MKIHPYYKNKAKQLLEKIKRKIGIISPSNTFKNIGVAFSYNMRLGYQSARLKQLNHKLYGAYNIPCRVYAQEYAELDRILFNFKSAQYIFENQ